jgi:hypothetical protein
VIVGCDPHLAERHAELIARIVIVVGQMALDRMREAAVAGEAPDEGGEPCPAPQRPDLRQESICSIGSGRSAR